MRSKSIDITAETIRKAFRQIGPRQAQRMAIRLFHMPREHFETLVANMKNLRSRVVRCKECGDLTESVVCAICADPERDPRLLCVVENPQDVEAIENTKAYQGFYHVLHGSLDPKLERLNFTGSDALNLEDLFRRLAGSVKIEELVLALDQDTGGELTSLFIAKEVQGRFEHIRVTRLAVGIPFGGEVLYSDRTTLGQAILRRSLWEAQEKIPGPPTNLQKI